MSSQPHTPVEIRVRTPDKSVAETIRRKFPTFFLVEGNDLVFRSWLAPDESVSNHLKWLHGMIQHEGAFFRKIGAAGIEVVIGIRSSTRPLCLAPEALLLAHKLHLTTEIRFGK